MREVTLPVPCEQKIYTIPEVITEIRDSKSRDMLERMPFLEIREPTQEAIKAGAKGNCGGLWCVGRCGRLTPRGHCV